MAQVWTEIYQLLRQAQKNGNLDAVVLTDGEGLPMASATDNGTDGETTAAVAALARRVAMRVEERIGMDTIDESHFRDKVGRLLVCRLFEAGGQNLILIVLVDQKRTYRRVTNRLIKQVQKLWKVA